jgi:integrase
MALKRGMVTENPFLNLPISKGASNRERVLTDNEIGEIWRAAEKMTAPYGNIVRFLILTGQRRGEVAGLKWNELTPDLDSWILPGERTKNGATHIVPLSKPARDLLRSLLPEDEVEGKRVFAERRAKGELALPGLAGSFAGWSKSKTVLDKAIMEARVKTAADCELATPLEPWTLHDIRRSVATGLQRLGVRLEVTEAVLNHISGSRGGIAGVYQRHDWANEKRAALDAWADHLITISEGQFSCEQCLTSANHTGVVLIVRPT